MKTIRFIAAAGILAILGSCSGKQAENTTTESVEEIPVVEVGVASLRDVPQNKTYTANVEPYITNNISPQMANRIREIKVDVGDRVSRGQTLVTLDDANLTQVRLAKENAQREYDRAMQLLEIGAGTQQAVDQLRTQLDSYTSQYNNLVDNTVLKSPANGVVISRNYDPGDMSGQMPVLTVGEIGRVKVLINISENDFSKVHNGMPVTVTFDAIPGESFQGNIQRIYPTVDSRSRTFQSEIIIPNGDGRLLPGMFARVAIELGTQNHVVIPDRALIKQQGSGNRYVYVYNNGAVSFKRVEVGQRIGDIYELISGIEDGDTVVIAGQSRLIDGSRVQLLDR